MWAEVDSVGRLTGIRFTDQARGLSGDQLADVVMRTIIEARTKAGRQAIDTAMNGFGLPDTMLGQLQALYMPQPSAEPEPEPPKAQDAGLLMFRPSGT